MQRYTKEPLHKAPTYQDLHILVEGLKKYGLHKNSLGAVFKFLSAEELYLDISEFQSQILTVTFRDFLFTKHSKLWTDIIKDEYKQNPDVVRNAISSLTSTEIDAACFEINEQVAKKARTKDPVRDIGAYASRIFVKYISEAEKRKPEQKQSVVRSIAPATSTHDLAVAS